MSSRELFTQFPPVIRHQFSEEHPKFVTNIVPSPQFSPGLCSRYTNPGIYVDPLVSGSRLAAFLVDQLGLTDWEDFTVEEKELVTASIAPILLLLLNNLHSEIACDDVLRLVPAWGVCNPSVVCEFLNLIRSDILSALIDETTGMKTFADLMEFARCIYRVCSRHNGCRGSIIRCQLALPSYLPDIIQSRIVLCMLHPEPLAMRIALRRKFVNVRGSTWNSGWLTRPLHPNLFPFEEWEDALWCLPDVKVADKVTSMRQSSAHIAFEDSVWNLNKPSDRRKWALSVVSPSSRDRITHPVKNPDRSQLLKQMFTMFLPNWRQLWSRFHWPRNDDVYRRLCLFLDSGKFYPDVDSVVQIMFGEFSVKP